MLTASSVSALEATWSLVAVIGVAVATGFLAHIWLSYRSVHEWIRRGWAVRWGPRHKFVLGFLVGAGLLLLVWLGFVLLGINAALNAPPTTPDRAAASERGGWILVGLEVVLLGVTALLGWAWVTVGKPTIASDGEAETISDLLKASTDAGREMAHAIADDLQVPVAVLDQFSRDERLTDDARRQATEALACLDRVMARVRQLHREIKRLGGVS